MKNIVFTNEKIFKIKMIDWPQCTFCKNEIDSFEHLFYNCEITRSLWVVLRSWLMECNINLEPLPIFNVLFGIFNAGKDFVIVNRPILVAKFYICDPPQEFDAKGESTRTTRLHDTLSVP